MKNILKILKMKQKIINEEIYAKKVTKYSNLKSKNIFFSPLNTQSNFNNAKLITNFSKETMQSFEK